MFCSRWYSKSSFSRIPRKASIWISDSRCSQGITNRGRPLCWASATAWPGSATRSLGKEKNTAAAPDWTIPRTMSTNSSGCSQHSWAVVRITSPGLAASPAGISWMVVELTAISPKLEKLVSWRQPCTVRLPKRSANV